MTQYQSLTANGADHLYVFPQRPREFEYLPTAPAPRPGPKDGPVWSSAESGRPFVCPHPQHPSASHRATDLARLSRRSTTDHRTTEISPRHSEQEDIPAFNPPESHRGHAQHHARPGLSGHNTSLLEVPVSSHTDEDVHAYVNQQQMSWLTQFPVSNGFSTNHENVARTAPRQFHAHAQSQANQLVPFNVTPHLTHHDQEQSRPETTPVPWPVLQVNNTTVNQYGSNADWVPPVQQSKLRVACMLLKDVAEVLVSDWAELDRFGHHLGLLLDDINRAKSNHSTNIEGTAWRLAWVWWNRDQRSQEEKLQVRNVSSVEFSGLQVAVEILVAAQKYFSFRREKYSCLVQKQTVQKGVFCAYTCWNRQQDSG